MTTHISRFTIDLDAVAANWRRLRGLASASTDCAAAVKANAYGLGLAQVTPSLAKAGCRVFAVAVLDEALALRHVLGGDVTVLLLNGVTPETAAAVRDCDAWPVLSSAAQVALWQQAAPGAPCAVQLETGMHRMGLTPDEVRAVLANHRDLDVRVIMSHLACADTPEHPLNEAQRHAFAAALPAWRERWPGALASLSNSAGVFLGEAYHHDLLRPGIALYGGNPAPRQTAPMQPVLRWEAPILRVDTVQAGAAVGYGATWTAPGPRRIATVAAGYADGLPRSLSNAWEGLIDQQAVPLVGRVSMDLTTFDVTEAAAAVPGAMITLLGGPLTLDAMAAAAGTISYEVLTGLGNRPARLYRGG